MHLFTHDFATISHARNNSNTLTATYATKRTAWYPAFGDMATWSPIG